MPGQGPSVGRAKTEIEDRPINSRLVRAIVCRAGNACLLSRME